jgi:hypothetical protein
MVDGQLIKNPSVVCTEMDDDGVLLDLDTAAYYSLNRTALRIWNLIDETPTVEDVATRMTREFAVEYEQALASAQRLIAKLQQEGLIRVESA